MQALVGPAVLDGAAGPVVRLHQHAQRAQLPLGRDARAGEQQPAPRLARAPPRAAVGECRERSRHPVMVGFCRWQARAAPASCRRRERARPPRPRDTELNGGIMPQADKSSYSSKQKRQARHIEEGYEKRGTGSKEAARRAWATVNKETGGGQKSGPGRGQATNPPASRKGGRKGGSASKGGRKTATSSRSRKRTTSRSR